MFKQFRKNKSKLLPIQNALKQGEKISKGNFGLTLMYKNQVLLQIVRSKFFVQHGFKPKNLNSFCELNFFNKNKTNTEEFKQLFDSEDNRTKYFKFENPKENYNYILELGNDFEQIESKVSTTVKEIYNLAFEEINIELNY